jgi:chloramphenicol-sensitive protein RarD
LQTGQGHHGWVFGLTAYGLWGFLPLYFWALRHVSPWEIVAQRVVWSAVLLLLIVATTCRWQKIRTCLRQPATRRTLVLTSILIGLNWFLFVYAASTSQLTQASLGYFVAPLVNTALGVFVLGERLRRSQQVALALAATGVVVLTLRLGEVPWLAISLAVSFCVYGLLRKTVAADALTGLAIETFILTPFVAAFLVWQVRRSTWSFAQGDRLTDLLLISGGVVTVFPLYCFTEAARRLRLTTLGFLQFLSPTIQLVLATTAFGEPFDHDRLAGFVPIWLALGIYLFDAVSHHHRSRRGMAAAPVIE